MERHEKWVMFYVPLFILIPHIKVEGRNIDSILYKP